jgi:hypothetical protein
VNDDKQSNREGHHAQVNFADADADFERKEEKKKKKKKAIVNKNTVTILW